MTYSIIDKLRLCFFVIRSKLISSNIRIIRFPIDLRGRKYIYFGHNFTTGRYCRLEVYQKEKNKEPRLYIGDNVQLNDFVHITVMESVKIGNNVLMASNIFISDCQHGFYFGENQSAPNIPPMEREYLISPVVIEDNVWLGEQVCILPGVVIGEGSIIGAGSIVNQSIPARSIAVGSPAKVVKKWNADLNAWVKV